MTVGETYIAQGMVKGCKTYTVHHPKETLTTIAKKFNVEVKLLQEINPQITSNKLRVYNGWTVNVPSDAHESPAPAPQKGKSKLAAILLASKLSMKAALEESCTILRRGGLEEK